MSIRHLLISASLLLLTLSAVFGLLNNSKVKFLRAERADTLAARDAVERAGAAQRQATHAPAATSPATSAKSAENGARAANAGAELVKSQNEKASLQSQVQAKEVEIAQLQKRIGELGAKSRGSDSALTPSVTELQAQLAETRTQLDNAEREKSLLSETIGSRHERSPQAIEERTKSRRVISQPGVHGTVLAVNQAYNFVVLNLGGRQGIEANSEMLVVRGTTLIGKIRISSVEPATAIGDIISSSLPRGVQVQPGDVVIYAGNNS